MDSMSFLKDKIHGESSGNLSSDDDFEEYDEGVASNKLPNKVQPKKQFPPQIAEPSTFKDDESEADWNFLLSFLPYMERIEGGGNKFRFRLEALIMLFNYTTDNMDAKENHHEGRPSVDVKVEKKDDQRHGSKKKAAKTAQQAVKEAGMHYKLLIFVSF